MRVRTCLVLAAGLLACAGCSKKKSTDELIRDLNGREDRDRIIAVRTLAQRSKEAAKVVPALTGALQSHDSDVRISAALGLGSFGEQAREAIPALQQAALQDRDARVREASRKALIRIDPSLADQPAARQQQAR